MGITVLLLLLAKQGYLRVNCLIFGNWQVTGVLTCWLPRAAMRLWRRMGMVCFTSL
jgi:hypothetical protein